MHSQSESFLKAFDRLIIHEGGYVDDVLDKGGESKYGISKRTYPDLDIKNLTIEEAKKIYYRDYWLKSRCPEICDLNVSCKLFDLCVNMGIYNGVRILQRALRAVGIIVVEDGKIGPITLRAVNRSSDSLVVGMRSEAAGYYRSIVFHDKTQQRFLVGWLNRAYA